MKLLALETSTLRGSIALVADGSIVVEHQMDIRQTYSELLLTLIDQVLRSSGMSIGEVDAFAVARGPGSFTSLRIGMSVVTGLSLATRKQVIAIPSLDGLAYNIFCSEHVTCPLLDARRGEVYTAFYRGITDAAPQRISPYRVVRPDTLLDEINERVVFIGDGATLYRNVIVERMQDKALFAPLHLNFPRASAIAALALQEMSSHAYSGYESIAPLYVRAPDAELNSPKKR